MFKMQDKNGKTITLGTLLATEDRPDHPLLRCIKVFDQGGEIGVTGRFKRIDDDHEMLLSARTVRDHSSWVVCEYTDMRKKKEL